MHYDQSKVAGTPSGPQQLVAYKRSTTAEQDARAHAQEARALDAAPTHCPTCGKPQENPANAFHTGSSGDTIGTQPGDTTYFENGEPVLLDEHGEIVPFHLAFPQVEPDVPSPDRRRIRVVTGAAA